MSRLWRADRLPPISVRFFFPTLQPRSSDEYPAPPRSSAAGAQEIFRSHGATPDLLAFRDGECPQKIFAPRARPKEGGWGFTWSWEGLSEAKVPDLGGYTDQNGCLKEAPRTDFKVKLQSPYLAVQRIQDPEKKIWLPFVKEGPFFFIEPGPQIFEFMVAANAFAVANQGLADFREKVYPWLSQRVQSLEIHQTASFGPTLPECVAERTPGNLYLPLICPSHDGFVAKGLCSDVIIHELSHEVLGSLVGLTTADTIQSLQDPDINEALSSFFPLYFKSKALSLHYAPLCQNDSFEVYNGDGELNKRSLISAFVLASNDVKDILARLVVLTALYDWPSTDKTSPVDKFFDTFFDFAAEKAKLDESTLKPICEALWKHAGIPPDKRCPDLTERCAHKKSDARAPVNVQGSVEDKGQPAIFDKLLPGFSITEGGSVQGWTTDGHQITMWYVPGQKYWEQRINKRQPSIGGPRIALSEWLGRSLHENPRIEILDIDAFEVELAVWPEQGVPQIARYPFGQEIDPTSLTIGVTERGPVFEVTTRSPNASRAYALRDGALRETSDLAVFPLENPSLSFRSAGREVGVALDLFSKSVCGAPPYLRFVRKHLIALTCDGVLASYIPDDKQIFRRSWFKELGGILSPGIDGSPIQFRSSEGSAESPRLLLGPFRYGPKDRPEDRTVVLSLGGEPLAEAPPGSK